MNLFKSFGGTVTSAVKTVAEKNRKTSAISRLKAVVKNEEDSANEAYIALGKYYYSRLRSEGNDETEPYCQIVDQANRRIERALGAIETLSDPSVSWLPTEDTLAEEEKEEAPVLENPLETEDVQDEPAEDVFAATGFNEWLHTIHVETAEETAVPDEVEQNSDQGIPW